jgi:hypothetical protein
VIRIGTKSLQKRTFLAGVSGRTLSGSAQPVLVKANGQLGTASSAVKSSSARPLSAAAGQQLLATVRRQQREIAQLRAEVQKGG